MQRWQGLGEVPRSFGRSVVTIGVFDGVHRGHQRIVARAGEAAAQAGLPVVVVTFDPHPAEIIRPGTHPPMLCPVGRRAELLGGLGADAVCVLPFTREFSRLSPDEFVQAVLAERLHAAAVVVGENFTFGHRAAGDVALLADLGEKHDYTAEGVPLLREAGVTVSSSEIRRRLAEGDVAAAAVMLGRSHQVGGAVVRGEQRGRTLGFPTANVDTPRYAAVPADGVYAGWLTELSDGGAQAARWPAAISVGTNPTFDGQRRTVEAYALDRDDLDLYDRQVTVDFTAWLRGMVKFSSVDELIGQMHRDVDSARTLTSSPGGNLGQLARREP